MGAAPIARREVGRLRSDLTGVVLCGGRSRRMGADKAVLDLAGATLLERSAATLSPIAAEVVLACGPTRRYPELGLRLVLDLHPDGGPLAGLEAGLSGARTTWIAALACDMPRADATVFAALLSRALERDLDACLLETSAGVEPLCAVYRASCLEPVRAALAAGERKLTSFWRFPMAAGALPRVGTLPDSDLPAGVAGLGVAVNLNTPEDLSNEIAAGTLRPTTRSRA